eukprot:tig00021521_g22060.t1
MEGAVKPYAAARQPFAPELRVLMRASIAAVRAAQGAWGDPDALRAAGRAARTLAALAPPAARFLGARRAARDRSGAASAPPPPVAPHDVHVPMQAIDIAFECTCRLNFSFSRSFSRPRRSSRLAFLPAFARSFSALFASLSLPRPSGRPLRLRLSVILTSCHVSEISFASSPPPFRFFDLDAAGAELELDASASLEPAARLAAAAAAAPAAKLRKRKQPEPNDTASASTSACGAPVKSRRRSARAEGPSSSAALSALERLPDDILLAVYCEVARTEGVLGLVRSLGGASRRLRGMCWHAALFEEPDFGASPLGATRERDSDLPLVDACLKHAGHLVRRLCLSGFFFRELGSEETSRIVNVVLSRTPHLTHLSLAHMRVPRADDVKHFSEDQSEDGEYDRDPYGDRRRQDELGIVHPLVIRSLPPLRSLVTLNLSDVIITPDALRSVVSGASATLQSLFLSNTLVACLFSKKKKSYSFRSDEDEKLRAHSMSVLLPIAELRLPRLRALDLSHSDVKDGLLVDFVNAHPSLADLYLVRLKKDLDFDKRTYRDESLIEVWKRIVDRELLGGLSPERILDPKPLDPGTFNRLFSALAKMPGDACAGLEARNAEGRTPFLAAVEAGDFDLARRLKEAGADTSAVCHPYPYFAASPAKRWVRALAGSGRCRLLCS